MTRVPTYTTNMNLLNQSLKIKKEFELYNYQSITGLKSQSYSGYGMSAYSIVNLEASLNITSNFIENNKLLNIELNTMSTSMETITNTANDLKHMLNNFSGSSVKNLTPDYTGGEITFTDNNQDSYIGHTITINGTQYTFTANDDSGNNIDLSAIAADNGSEGYATKVMQALKNKIDPTGNYPDYEFDEATFKFPLYTINGGSSILSAPGVKTGEPYTMNSDQAHNLNELQTFAFTSMQMITDALNVEANGKYLFGGGEASSSPIKFPFGSLEEFQSYYDGINIKFPNNAAANLCNRSTSAKQTGGITIDNIEGNQFKITSDNAGGFLETAVVANPATVGTLTFNADKNTINATEYGAFNSIKAGDTLVLSGTENNNNSFVVKSVSADGKTITFEDNDGHNIVAEDAKTDPTGITISTSYPIGAIIEMNNMGNNVAPRVQVTGVNADGTLNVTADPGYFATDSTYIPNSSQWSMETFSYYTGGDLALDRRISENQSISMDITANNGAFEKLFRSLGQIAQGNMVDTSNPADINGLIDVDKAANIVYEAISLMQSAIDDSGETTKSGINSSLYAVTAKLSANFVLLDSVDENLTLVQNNLQNSIDSIKKVDQTEAAVKALMAQNTLAASYSVLQNAISMSLLNYMD
ncbi:MAG: hypothetical protein E7019_02270 [Alphaproteobacteria bacterium]|nr:hypothetical protein [Alphaproteobacteria bacterium]